MKKGIYLIGILLVPSVIYLLFSLGEHNMAQLGFYGDFELDANGDTNFLPVQVPEMVNAKGASITPSSLNGKVTLVHFFDWPCEEDCKNRFATLNNYLHKLGMESEWVLLSICADSIPADELKALSQKNWYEHNNWQYARGGSLSGFRQALYEPIAREQSEGDEPLHMADLVVLLDQQQRIRSYFDIRLQQDNKRMEDALKLIIQEPHISWKNQ